MAFSAAAVSAAEQKCSIAATRVTTIWVDGAPPGGILDNLCPGDCSGQGTCTLGKKRILDLEIQNCFVHCRSTSLLYTV